LWMQALDEGRRRAHQELNRAERLAADQQQNLDVRSHVLTLREGELDSRLRDRDRTIDDLSLRLRELTTMLRKEQATRESLSIQLVGLQSPRTRLQKKTRRTQKSATTKRRVKPSKSAVGKRRKARLRR
jgi:hypothetical protein